MKVTYRVEYPEMSERVKQLRRSRSWNQQQFATAAGVAISTVQKIEQGGEVPVEIATIERLAEVLGVTVAEVTGAPSDGVPGWVWVNEL